MSTAHQPEIHSVESALIPNMIREFAYGIVEDELYEGVRVIHIDDIRCQVTYEEDKIPVATVCFTVSDSSDFQIAQLEAIVRGFAVGYYGKYHEERSVVKATDEVILKDGFLAMYDSVTLMVSFPVITRHDVDCLM